MAEPIKPYFQVQRPYNFRAHPSFISEMAIPERMHTHLPQSRQQYVKWLEEQELTSDQAPLGVIVGMRGKPYQLTPRYLLQSVILPGRLCATNLITDGNLWTIWCDVQGIADFVQRRAAEFASHHGVPFDEAMAMLRPAPVRTASTERIYPEWAIGYETAGGNAIVLDANHRETPQRFLQGTGPVCAPFNEAG